MILIRSGQAFEDDNSLIFHLLNGTSLAGKFEDDAFRRRQRDYF